MQNNENTLWKIEGKKWNEDCRVSIECFDETTRYLHIVASLFIGESQEDFFRKKGYGVCKEYYSKNFHISNEGTLNILCKPFLLKVLI